MVSSPPKGGGPEPGRPPPLNPRLFITTITKVRKIFHVTVFLSQICILCAFTLSPCCAVLIWPNLTSWITVIQNKNDKKPWNITVYSKTWWVLSKYYLLKLWICMINVLLKVEIKLSIIFFKLVASLYNIIWISCIGSQSMHSVTLTRAYRLYNDRNIPSRTNGNFEMSSSDKSERSAVTLSQYNVADGRNTLY